MELSEYTDAELHAELARRHNVREQARRELLASDLYAPLRVWHEHHYVPRGLSFGSFVDELTAWLRSQQMPWLATEPPEVVAERNKIKLDTPEGVARAIQELDDHFWVFDEYVDPSD